MATWEPGLTKPATRAVSVRLTETADSLSSIGRAEVAVTSVAELVLDDLLARVDLHRGVLAGEGLERRLVARLEVVAHHRLHRDLAGGGCVVDGLPGLDGLRDPQHLDGLEATLGTLVGAADVQEHECRAHQCHDDGDHEEDASAVHRYLFGSGGDPWSRGGCTWGALRSGRSGSEGARPERDHCNEKPRTSQTFQELFLRGCDVHGRDGAISLGRGPRSRPATGRARRPGAASGWA